jgi:hypothetical protein
MPYGQQFGSGVMSGPLVSPAGGRTDILPIDVAAGSYVIPADVVSGMPGAQGSSLAGHNALNKLFASAPLGAEGAPYGVDIKKRPMTQPMIPGMRRAQRHLFMNAPDQLPLYKTGGAVWGERYRMAVGGKTDGEDDHWRGKPPVSIMAAGGEHVIPPHQVEWLGAGSLSRGHRILDRFVKEVRKKNIKDLQKLPPPAKD